MRTFFVLLFALAIAFIIQSCSQDSTVNVKPDNNTGKIEGTCGTTVFPLIAGQHTNVGTVTVENDLTNIYVTYTLTNPDACFGTLHVGIVNDLTNLPGGGTKRPAPGQMQFQHNTNGATTYTFVIPFTDINIVDVNNNCGLNLYVVAHAEVDMDCNPGTPGHETAFGGNVAGLGNSWWYYGMYAICCDFGNPPIEDCNTAFAKQPKSEGGYVFVKNGPGKSNPEVYPGLDLTKNRWGWAINLANNVTNYTMPLWAGAGLNDTTKGTKVGTLTISWNGTTANVTYNINTGFTMAELHLYAGDDRPVTIAPGQYGFLEYFNPGVTSYSINDIPLVNVSGGNNAGVWLIAHAVVCGIY